MKGPIYRSPYKAYPPRLALWPLLYLGLDHNNAHE